MAKKCKETGKEGITVVTYFPLPLLVYPPRLSREEQAEFDRLSQERMLRYPVARSNSGLDIVVGVYEKNK